MKHWVMIALAAFTLFLFFHHKKSPPCVEETPEPIVTEIKTPDLNSPEPTEEIASSDVIPDTVVPEEAPLEAGSEPIVEAFANPPTPDLPVIAPRPQIPSGSGNEEHWWEQ